jgi:hypothetical protein
MKFLAADVGQSFLSSLGQGYWMRDRGVRYFPLQMFSGNGYYQPVGETVSLTLTVYDLKRSFWTNPLMMKDYHYLNDEILKTHPASLS